MFFINMYKNNNKTINNEREKQLSFQVCTDLTLSRNFLHKVLKLS